MTQQSFVYVTYIRTTPGKPVGGLSHPEFTRNFWFGYYQESDWKAGSSWKLIFADGRIADSGEVLEASAAETPCTEVAQRISARTECRGSHPLQLRHREAKAKW